MGGGNDLRKLRKGSVYSDLFSYIYVNKIFPKWPPTT